MLHIVCFSKDRPLQLWGYIESLSKHALVPFGLEVIYAASSRGFLEAYQQVAEEFAGVRFVRESDITADVQRAVAGVGAPFFMFGCDDVVFVDDFTEEPATLLDGAPDALAFSLRLGTGITFSHPARVGQRFPGQVLAGTPFCRWSWVAAGRRTDFGYPFELDATVYRTEDVRRYLGMLGGKRLHPNVLEESFYDGAWRTFAAERPEMFSYETPRAVVVTVNRVQDLTPNPIYAERSTAELLQAFLAGQRLDVDRYVGRRWDRVHIGDLFLRPA